MTADLTREQAREQVARIIAAQRYHYGAAAADRDADIALTVLWPVVESLRAERDAAVLNVYRLASDRDVADAELAGLRFEIANLTAELAHAHTVIARHVEPRRGRVGGKDGQYASDPLYRNAPSDALYGDLTASGPAAGVAAPDDRTEPA